MLHLIFILILYVCMCVNVPVIVFEIATNLRPRRDFKLFNIYPNHIPFFSSSFAVGHSRISCTFNNNGTLEEFTEKLKQKLQ